MVDAMRRPELILDVLSKKARNKDYVFEGLYKNLYNPDFFLKAYGNIYAKEGNMTEGTDGKTIDGFNLELVEKLIESLKRKLTNLNLQEENTFLRKMVSKDR